MSAIKRSSPTRHRRVLSENEFQNATWFIPALKRMTLKVGVARTSGDTYQELLNYAGQLLDKIVEKSIYIAEYAKRTTVKVDDVVLALQSIGDTFYPIDPEGYTLCKISKKKKLESKMSDYEKQTECHYLAKAPFIRAVRQASQDVKVDMRWSEDAIVNVLAFIEAKLLQLLQKASAARDHAGRTTLQADDVQLVQGTCGF